MSASPPETIVHQFQVEEPVYRILLVELREIGVIPGMLSVESWVRLENCAKLINQSFVHGLRNVISVERIVPPGNGIISARMAGGPGELVRLKGPELDLPEGKFFFDKENIPRKRIRARWWGLPDGPAPVGGLVMPEPIQMEDEIPADEIRRLPNYGLDEPPVFFGHYWMPKEHRKAPLAPNLACLDYGTGLGEAPLVAYRWDGERILCEAKFFVPDQG